MPLRMIADLYLLFVTLIESSTRVKVTGLGVAYKNRKRLLIYGRWN